MSVVHVIENAATAWPVGTNVGAYPASGWPQYALPPSGAPVPSATETQAVQSDGSLQFVALLPNTRYFAVAQVSGTYVYRKFLTARVGRVPVATAGTAADQTIRAAVTGRKIKVEGYVLSAGGAVTAKWKSGASNDLSGSLKFADTGGVSHPTTTDLQALVTRRGEALVLNTAQAIVVGGHTDYTLEPVA